MSSVEQRNTREMEYIPLSNLQLAEIRDIREHVVQDISERIQESEYNPSRPLRVVKNGSGYKVVDGNHRVSALRRIESIDSEKPIPCVVEPDSVDIYELAHKSNRDEDTYAEEDLFDHLDYIADLRDDHTQAEIAERLNWSRDKVAKRARLLNEVVPGALEIARNHQQGRGTEDVPSGTFGEYWFRTSGLYNLNRDGVDEYALPSEDSPKHAQVRVIEWFCEDQNCDASKSAVQRRVEGVLEKCEQLDQLEEQLNPGVDQDLREELRQAVIAGEYTDNTLNSAIENANRDAKDRTMFGTGAIGGLETVEENSIDCVVMDPPYGVDYESHRDTARPEFEDGFSETMAMLDDVFSELKRVCKANAHIYIFFPMKSYGPITEIAGQYFDVTEVPLIWSKNNHAPTRDAEEGFSKMYAHQYEPILICRMPKGDRRELNGGVSPNVLRYSRPSGDERWHDSQKPRDLLADLITNSTGKHETVLDPFAGSGSTLLAAKSNQRHYLGIEKNDEYESRFKRELREVRGDV